MVREKSYLDYDDHLLNPPTKDARRNPTMTAPPAPIASLPFRPLFHGVALKADAKGEGNEEGQGKEASGPRVAKT